MTTYTKLQAASHQLDRAIGLFLEGDYLCSLTLAGAAEDIFAGLTAAAGGVRALDWVVADMQKTVDISAMAAKDTELINLLNRARNSVKHADRETDDIEVTWADALTMIYRALPMAGDLSMQSEWHRRFADWVVANEQRITDYLAS